MILDNTFIVITQVLILFILIGVGFIAGKVRMVNDQGIRQLTNILLVIITPSLIFQSFQTAFDVSLIRGMLIALVSAIFSHLAGALIGWVIYHKSPDDRSRVMQFSVVFSNCGFMCIPLLDAILGSRGVLYGSVYIAVFNIAQWTYGVRLMTGGNESMNFKRALINPGNVSIMIALPLFLLGVRLPAVPTLVIGHLSAINSPLAMMLIGAQLSMIKLSSIFTDRDVIGSSLLRLFAVPVIVILALAAVPLEMDRILFLACVIPAAAPTAAGVALFATRHDQNAMLATRNIAFSTMLSIVSIPLLILLSDFLRGY